MSRHRRWTVETDQRGSVLVPLVAAMLLLSLCGSALADLFSAQRLQSVLGVESSQAYWVAEAGAWHAAYEGAEIPTATPFGGGTYTATRIGDSYTSTGLFGSARRIARQDGSASGGSGGGPGGGPPADPLDIAASLATVRRDGDKKFEIDLVSLSDYPVVISSFSLNASWWTWPVKKLELDGDKIWEENNGVWVPTGVLPMNEGDPEDRLILAGDDPTLKVEFRTTPFWIVNYTLVLRYTNGASSTLSFSLRW